MNQKKHAISLCQAILGSGASPWNFEGYCLELKETLHELSTQGRYGDVRVVMNEFEERCKFNRLDAPQMGFLATVMPLSLDSAVYLMHKESAEVASIIVKNLIQYQCFTRDEGGDIDLDELMEQMLDSGFAQQACELLDGLMEAYKDDHDAFMVELMKAINYAFSDGHEEVISWVRQNESAVTHAYLSTKNSHGYVSVGIELFEAGVEIFGAEMIKAMVAPHGYDLIQAEELIGISPSPFKAFGKSQDAYVNYMLSKEYLSPQWSDVSVNLSSLVGESRESLSKLLSMFNADGRITTPPALNRVCAAMIRQAKDYTDLDAIKLEMNRVNGDLYSPAVVDAINHIVPTIAASRPAPMAPAILYLDNMMNRMDKVDFSPHTALIESKINEWAPTMSLSDFARYAERIDKFQFDRKAMGASIEAKWPSANETMRELLKDVTPKSVALTSRALKGSVIERELGL